MYGRSSSIGSGYTAPRGLGGIPVVTRVHTAPEVQAGPLPAFTIVAQGAIPPRAASLPQVAAVESAGSVANPAQEVGVHPRKNSFRTIVVNRGKMPIVEAAGQGVAVVPRSNSAPVRPLPEAEAEELQAKRHVGSGMLLVKRGRVSTSGIQTVTQLGRAETGDKGFPEELSEGHGGKDGRETPSTAATDMAATEVGGCTSSAKSSPRGCVNLDGGEELSAASAATAPAVLEGGSSEAISPRGGMDQDDEEEPCYGHGGKEDPATPSAASTATASTELGGSPKSAASSPRDSLRSDSGKEPSALTATAPAVPGGRSSAASARGGMDDEDGEGSGIRAEPVRSSSSSEREAEGAGGAPVQPRPGQPLSRQATADLNYPDVLGICAAVGAAAGIVVAGPVGLLLGAAFGAVASQAEGPIGEKARETGSWVQASVDEVQATGVSRVAEELDTMCCVTIRERLMQMSIKDTSAVAGEVP